MVHQYKMKRIIRNLSTKLDVSPRNVMLSSSVAQCFRNFGSRLYVCIVYTKSQSSHRSKKNWWIKLRCSIGILFLLLLLKKMFLWKYSESPFCDCDNATVQSMRHIINDCPFRRFPRGISEIHSASPASIMWLKNLDLTLWTDSVFHLF